MKATIEIPDALYRQVKSRSALSGRTIRDVTVELYRRWIDQGAGSTANTNDAASNDAVAAWLSRWEILGSEIEAAAADGPSTREQLVADRR